MRLAGLPDVPSDRGGGARRDDSGIPRGPSMLMINLVVPSSGIAIGELDENAFEATRAAVTKALTKAGVPWAVGGFDVSANEDERGRFEPFWQPHLVFFAPDSIRGESERAFRRFFPATKRVP